jgi:DNA-binding LacI/PurR family transcriptional regulator
VVGCVIASDCNGFLHRRQRDHGVSSGADAGIRVPQELSLVVIDDKPAQHPLATLDTFEIPFQQLGQLAVQQLLQKIEAPDEFLPPRTLPLSLVRGETCARAPN